MLARRVPPPLVTAPLLIPLALLVRLLGRPTPAAVALADQPRRGVRTATLSTGRANLADAGCMFTVDVELGSVWQQMIFARIRMDARKEIVTMLRYKRRYMVDTPVAREAL